MNQNESVCNLTYLTEMMGNKKHLIKGIMDTFLQQVPEELQCINNAIKKLDYSTIKNYAHTMKSSISIMGISVLVFVLKEMEDLAGTASGPDSYRDEKIKKLNEKLNLICQQAVEEIEKEKHNYI
jgi:HPt (histidine-containing phosphotransfer) domain-containing protein